MTTKVDDMSDLGGAPGLVEHIDDVDDVGGLQHVLVVGPGLQCHVAGVRVNHRAVDRLDKIDM